MFTVNVGDVFSPFDKNFQNSRMLNNRSARFQYNSDPRMRDTDVEAQQLLIFNENEQELIATITFIRTGADIGWEIINDGGFGSSSTGVLKAQEREDLNLNIEKLVPVPEEIRDQILGCYDTFFALCDSVKMSINNLKKNQTLKESDKEMFIAALLSGDQNLFPEGQKNFAAKVFTPENRADWFRNALLNQPQRT
jgi:hypothetical protein